MTVVVDRKMAQQLRAFILPAKDFCSFQSTYMVPLKFLGNLQLNLNTLFPTKHYIEAKDKRNYLTKVNMAVTKQLICI